MPTDSASPSIKCRLHGAQKSVASLFGASGSSSGGGGGSITARRISTPQLIKRRLHVTFDQSTGTYQGVPTQWQSDFDKLAEDRRMSSVSASDSEKAAAAGGRVWFDHCSRRFVNLPQHWCERLQRNNLTDWAEFQRNPDLLTAVFTMMDEELSKMDLASMGLESSTFYSPATHSTEGGNAGKSETAASNALQHHAESHQQQVASEAARKPTVGIVWTQQRSFVKDDDSDSEEFAEL